MRAKRVVLLVMVLSLVLLGCGFDFGSKATPTNTPQPLPTVAPTDTPAAEQVAAPTNTPKAEKEVAPTNTPKAEAVAPTNTPESAAAEPTATKASSGIARPTAESGGVEVKPTTDGGQGGVVTKGGDTSTENAFEFVSHTAWVDDYGGITIVGEARNVSDQTIDTMVSVVAVLTDADGETVPGDFGAYLDRPVIAPGETSSFWVPVTADQLGDVSVDSITDYELTCWVSEEPSPDVEITVDSADIYEESDALYVRGTSTNSSDIEFAGLSVYSIIYDADGNVMNATVDYITLDAPLAPGDQIDFEGYFIDHFEGADSFNVCVTGWTAEQTGGTSEQPSTDALRSGDDVFSVDSHTGWIDDSGNGNIVGYVTNYSSETINNVSLVQAILTDADGNDLEGEFTTYVDRPSIAPGEWSSFWLWVSVDDLGGVDPDSITDYELLTWITDQTSPDVELTVETSAGTIENDAYYVTGTVTNQTDLEFVALAVYSSIYDDAGNILNSTVDIIELDTPLGPGETTDFSGYFVDHFAEATNYAVIVTGYTAEATGQ